jgi:hypothetical protein
LIQVQFGDQNLIASEIVVGSSTGSSVQLNIENKPTALFPLNTTEMTNVQY